MENLKLATIEQLSHVVQGIVLAFEYNDPIDERYCIEWHIQAYDNHFKVIYMWTKGIVRGGSGNPEYTEDDKCINEESYFKILRNDSLTKFTKEVICSIEEVVKEPFDELAEA